MASKPAEEFRDEEKPEPAAKPVETVNLPKDGKDESGKA